MKTFDRWAILDPEGALMDWSICKDRKSAWQAFLNRYFCCRGGKQAAYDKGYRAVRVTVTVEGGE